MRAASSSAGVATGAMARPSASANTRSRPESRRAIGLRSATRTRSRPGSSLAISTEAIQGLLCTRAAASESDRRTRFFPWRPLSARRTWSAETRPIGAPLTGRTSTSRSWKSGAVSTQATTPAGSATSPTAAASGLSSLTSRLLRLRRGGAPRRRKSSTRPPAPGGITVTAPVIPAPLLGQGLGQPVDVARAEGDHHVFRPHLAAQQLRRVLPGRGSSGRCGGRCAAPSRPPSRR